MAAHDRHAWPRPLTSSPLAAGVQAAGKSKTSRPGASSGSWRRPRRRGSGPRSGPTPRARRARRSRRRTSATGRSRGSVRRAPRCACPSTRSPPPVASCCWPDKGEARRLPRQSAAASAKLVSKQMLTPKRRPSRSKTRRIAGPKTGLSGQQMPLAIAARHRPASDDNGGVVEVLALRLDQADDGGRRRLGQLRQQVRDAVEPRSSALRRALSASVR